MILTADVSNINPQVKAAHSMFCADILKELGLGQTPRTATRMEVDDDETQEVDTDETQDGGRDTHGQAGGRDDTYCDIDAEGL